MEMWMLVAGLFLVAVGRVVYADFFSNDARVKRWLARQPRVRIADVADGVVRVTGQVGLLTESLRAPVTGRPCAAYRLVIEMPDADGSWEQVLELAGACPFAIADGSGEAVVDTASGPFTLVLLPDVRGPSRFRRTEEQYLKAARSLLEANQIAMTDWVGKPKTFQFSEAILADGRKVSVGGYATREIAPEGERAGYREPPERVVVRASPDQPLLISNWREAHGPREEPEAPPSPDRPSPPPTT